jgi:hypothetical protein
MIAPEIFQFFEKIADPNSICKGFPIYEPYGKISQQAYKNKLSSILLYRLPIKKAGPRLTLPGTC